MREGKTGAPNRAPGSTSKGDGYVMIGFVAQRFGVDLVYEVQFIGDWSDWRPEVA